MSETEARSSGIFDKFSMLSARHISRAWFFAVCCLAVIVWAVSGPIFGFNETWQLVINTGTTIVTFLMVALIQNTQDRSDKAIHHKLDALAEGMAYILENDEESEDFVSELRDMAGVEMEASQ